MARYTTYINNGPVIADAAGANAAGAPAQTVFVAEFDAALRNLATATTDDAVVMTLPAGVIVTNAVVEVVTANGAGTVDVGTAADVDGLVDGADASTTGLTLGAGAVVGTMLTAATDVVVACPVTATDLTTLKVRVVVEATTLG